VLIPNKIIFLLISIKKLNPWHCLTHNIPHKYPKFFNTFVQFLKKVTALKNAMSKLIATELLMSDVNLIQWFKSIQKGFKYRLATHIFIFFESHAIDYWFSNECIRIHWNHIYINLYYLYRIKIGEKVPLHAHKIFSFNDGFPRRTLTQYCNGQT